MLGLDLDLEGIGLGLEGFGLGLATLTLACVALHGQRRYQLESYNSISSNSQN